MFIVNNELSTKITIQKSKFISYAFYCDSQEVLQSKLKEIRRDNLSANHICYACCFYNNNDFLYYSSDDGEPSGTAGLQICQVIKENLMVNTLIVVVRYFGGIKLGVPGLSKAYKDSARECLIKNKKEVWLRDLYLINCEYSKFGEIKKILELIDIKLENVKYDKFISFNCYLNEEEFNKVSSHVSSFLKYKNTQQYI